MIYIPREIIKMQGRKILSVERSNYLGQDVIAFNFQDGHRQSFLVDGDCCSTSWIEHMEIPDDISGAVFYGYEESDPVEKSDPDSECLKVYSSRFRTSKGDIALEYRNSSNGYYGGSLTPWAGK